MKYYFNPNYRLIEDQNKVILTSRFSYFRKYSEFEGETDFTSYIHPIYASILSFFNGNDLELIYKEISECFSLSVNSVKSQFSKLINNKEQQYIEFDGTYIVFPSFTIIESTNEIENYTFTDPGIFLNYKEVNLKPSRTLKPIDLTLMVNTLCYTDCIYCYANKSNKLNCSIPVNRLDELVKEAKSLEMRSFDLIGGEVFLYKDWYHLITKLVENGFPPFISTKIPVKKDDIDKLNDLDLMELQFSLDALTEYEIEKLLKVNGKPYLNHVKTMFKHINNSTFNVTVHTILTALNCTIDNINRLYSFLKDQNISIWKIDFVQRSIYSSHSFNEIKVTLDLMQPVMDHLRQIAKNEKKIDIQYSDIVSLLQNGLKKTRENFLYEESRSCPANLSSFFILPDGNVTICEQFYWKKEYIIGNILKNSLLEVWNSDKAQDLHNRRRNIKNTKSPCHNCNDLIHCCDNSLVCYRDVVFGYGSGKSQFSKRSGACCMRTLPMWNA